MPPEVSTFSVEPVIRRVLSHPCLRASLCGLAVGLAAGLALCLPETVCATDIATDIATELPPAPESGDCSLADTTPATVMSIDVDAGGDVNLMMDDGRRASLAGLDFTSRAPTAQLLLTRWLAGRLVFVRAAAVDRWGRAPAQIFAAATTGPSSPLIAVGGAVIEAGLARYRPDPAAVSCRAPYLAAEEKARKAHAGLWGDADMRPVDIAAPDASIAVLQRRGLTLVEGVVRSVGDSRRAVYLNLGQRRGGDFTVVISRRFSYNQPVSGFDPRKWIGRRVRVRGLIDTGWGPRIEIAGPEDVEIIESIGAP